MTTKAATVPLKKKTPPKRAGSEDSRASSLTELLKPKYNPVPLYKITEVEEYNRTNPFILTGYRGSLNAFECIKSVFFPFHNETINIWSHFFGFAVFAWLLVRDLMLLYKFHQASFPDVIVLVGIIFCYQGCMILSAMFHTFTCHSKEASEMCLALDLFGITLALLATYLSGIYYAFWCSPFWRDFYFVTVIGISAFAGGIQFWKKFRAAENGHIRIGVFTTWAVYGVVPTIHWVIMHGGFSDRFVATLLPRIIIMYAICGIAFLFYIGKIPERWFPGKLDILGHSHQWWHAIIFLALLFWHNTGVNFALYRFSHGCSAPDNHAMESLSVWPF